MGEASVAFDPCGHETPLLDLEWLARLVQSLPLPSYERPGPYVLEVGSWAGSSALVMLEAGAKRVHCVDAWEGEQGQRVYEAFLLNIGNRLGRSIFAYRGKSVEVAAAWPFKLDLVFIDADHSYEACFADIKAWTPHVRHGGIVCGHDFHLAGVEQAVRETGPFERCGNSMWWRRA